MENLLRSIKERYLHFSRVDRYSDFPEADRHDGEQGPLDRLSNAALKLAIEPDLSAADYYDNARARTYACCFSLVNSTHIWTTYGHGSARGKVCLAFQFGALRRHINQIVSAGNGLMVGASLCRQIFSVNYGNVEYADWNHRRLNVSRLPNPMQYAYMKDRSFASENEHRISFSALGVGEYASTKLGPISFPPTLQLEFDFQQAASDLTLRECIGSPDCDLDFLTSELKKLGFEACER